MTSTVPGDLPAGIDLRGKKALVTGASRGIGRRIAVGYARAGADVAVLARTQEALQEVRGEIEQAGRRAVVVPCDVTDPEAVADAAGRVIDGLGHLDAVVNNAGGTSFLVPFTEMRVSGWHKTMRANVDSAVHVCQALAGHLLERGSGSVINMASVAGLGGMPAGAHYSAAKAALISLTKTLALEWAASGVRVNALCPGWTATELNRNLWEDEQASARLLAGVPMGRWGRVDEMVGPAVFLASDAATFLTGQVLVVDGGQTAG